jgi:hypothetical protein
MTTPPRHELLALRIRAVFTERPDLTADFRALCSVMEADDATCAAALDLLVMEGFLTRRPDGAFVRVEAELE